MAEEPEVSGTWPTVGLLGVGLLGSAIGERLSAAGIAWTGYDPARPDLAPDATTVWDSASVVILSLPDAAFAAEAVAAVTGPRTVIDTTTGDPDAMAAMAVRLGERGVRYLDVTIGGSSTHLRRGEAILMAGASAKDFDEAAALLGVLGRQVFHCGPPGAGARMKLVFNLVLGLNRAALGEGLALAEAMDLDGAMALAVLMGGPAASRIMERKGPKMLAGEYEPEARLAQHHKDVRLMRMAGERAGLALPLTEAHDAILAAAEEIGLGEADNSALIEAYRRGRFRRR